MKDWKSELRNVMREVESWGAGGLKVEKLGGLAQNDSWCAGGGTMGGETWPSAKKLFLLILCKYRPKIRFLF